MNISSHEAIKVRALIFLHAAVPPDELMVLCKSTENKWALKNRVAVAVVKAAPAMLTKAEVRQMQTEILNLIAETTTGAP